MFYKDPTGRVFHTYSTYERGIDMLNTVYHYLDPVPNGRDEAGLDLRKPGCVITISTTSRHERLQCWTFSSFEQPTVAAALLGPVRLDIVKPLTQPRSCPELAQLLNLPTQQVNYHMRRLIHEFGSVTELRQAHHITTPLCSCVLKALNTYGGEICPLRRQHARGGRNQRRQSIGQSQIRLFGERLRHRRPGGIRQRCQR